MWCCLALDRQKQYQDGPAAGSENDACVCRFLDLRPEGMAAVQAAMGDGAPPVEEISKTVEELARLH